MVEEIPPEDIAGYQKQLNVTYVGIKISNYISEIHRVPLISKKWYSYEFPFSQYMIKELLNFGNCDNFRSPRPKRTAVAGQSKR